MVRVPLITAGADACGQPAYVPERRFRQTIAGEAITAGNLVAYYKSGETMDGVRVYKTGAAGTDLVAGVAQHTAAAGASLMIQTHGLGVLNLATHSSGVAAAESLFPGGTAGAADGVATSSSTVYHFGYALAADTAGSVLYSYNYILDCKYPKHLPVISGGADQGGRAVFAPERRGRTVVAAEAITKGMIVTFYMASYDKTTRADVWPFCDGVTVWQTNAATDLVCGVALETVVAGQMLRIQTHGLGLVNLVTDGTVAVNQGLIGAASGAADGAAAPLNCVFGFATTADTGSVLYAGEYLLACHF